MPDTLDQTVEPIAPGYKPPGPITIIPDQPAAPGGLLDRVHARLQQEQQPAGGGLLDRVHARLQQEQQGPAPWDSAAHGPVLNAAHSIVSDTGGMAADTLSGVMGGVAHVNHLVANASDLMARGVDALSAITGLSKEHLLHSVADWARQSSAEQQKGAQTWAGGRQDFASQMNRGLIQGAVEAPLYMAAGHVAGPVAGMGLLGGLDESDKGVLPAVEGTAKGMLTGAAYHMMGPAAPYIRAPTAAALAYAEAVLRGEDPTSAAAKATTAGLQMIPGEGTATVRDMAGNARELAGKASDLIASTGASIPPLFPNRNPVSKAGADYMRSKGIEGNAATSSGSPVLQQIQKGADASPLGQIISRRAAARNEAKLRDLGQSHIEEATPETPPAQHYGAYQDIEDHPTSMREVPTGRVDEDGEPITQDMQMPVYIGDFKPEMRKIVARLSFRPVKTQSTSAALSSAKAILAADNYMPASVVEEGLSSLKEEGRDGEGRSAALAKSLIPRLQDRIDSSVQDVNPEALDHLQAGRRAAADQAGADWVSKTLEPATVGGGFSLEKAAQMLAAWRKLSDGDKATMFSADQARDLENFFVGLNDLAKNQPGTGKGLAGLGSGFLLGHFASLPVAGGAVTVAGGISKVLHSDFGIRLLTEGLNTDPNTPRGRQISAGIQNIIRPGGGPPPPGTPPEEESQPGPDDEGGGPPPPPPPGAPPGAPPAAAAPPEAPPGAPLSPEAQAFGGTQPEHDVPENPRQWMIDERQRQAAARQGFIDQAKAAGGQEAEQQQPAGALEAAAAAQQAKRQAFIDKWKAAGKPAEEPVPQDLANRQADVGTVQAGATDGTTETEMDAGATGAVDAGGTREGAAVHAAAPASARYPSSQQTGHATDLLLPGEKRTIPARYEVRELSQITPSHNGQTFSANPQYANVNERDYSKPENQQRVITSSSEEGFQPRWHITDNPDAVNGPPVIDENGNAVAGNSRAMMLQRVYGRNSTAATAYRNLLEHQAAHYGIDPEVVRGMKQPVLVRTVSTADLEALPGGSKYAIRKTNIAGTADLSSAERAMADAGQLSPDLVTHIGNVIDRHGPDATLNDALTGTSGISIVNHLIDSGFFSEQQRASLMDQQTGAVTQLAKDRISKAFLGQFFRDSDQIARTPAAVKAKIERIAAPLAKLSDNPQFDIRQDIGNAIDAMEYKRAQGFSNYADAHQQGGMFGNQENPITPRSAYFAGLLEDFNPNDLVDITRNYAANSVPEHTMFGNYDPTPQQAMSDAVTSVIGEQEKTALKPIDKKMAEAKEKGVAETSPAWQSLQEKRDTTVAEFAEKQKVYQRKAQIGLQTATATTGESEASPEAQQAFVAKVKRARKPKKPAS